MTSFTTIGTTAIPTNNPSRNNKEIDNMMPNYDKKQECTLILNPLIEQLRAVCVKYRLPMFFIWASGKTDSDWKTEAYICNHGQARTPAIFAAFYNFIKYGKKSFLSALGRLTDKGLNHQYNEEEVLRNEIIPTIQSINAFTTAHKVPAFIAVCYELTGETYSLHAQGFNGGEAEEDFPLMFGVFAWMAAKGIADAENIIAALSEMDYNPAPTKIHQQLH